MSLGKSSIDAQHSTIKKYIRFCLQYYCHACIVYLNSVGTLPSPKKIYFHFCLQYYYMGLNRQSTSTYKKKFVYDYSTTMVHGA